MPVSLLAIAAHRDDVELTCAGTLLKARDAGHATGILDLTGGEAGTRGSAELRAREAAAAAEVLGVAERRNAGLPDAGLSNTDETRRVVVEQIRHFRPRPGRNRRRDRLQRGWQDDLHQHGDGLLAAQQR